MKSMMWLVITKDRRRWRLAMLLWFLGLAVTTAAGTLVPVLVGRPGWKMLVQTLWMLQPFVLVMLLPLLITTRRQHKRPYGGGCCLPELWRLRL